MTSEYKNLKKLALCAVMVALGTVLSLIKVWQMPLGGAVTLASMLPVILVSDIIDVKWGLISAFVYSLIQLGLGIMIDGLLGWGLTPISLLGTVFLDYIIPFTLIGLAGVFAKKGTSGLIFGCIMVMLLRFFCHIISGCIIFANLEQFIVFGNTFVGRPLLYSVCYNGMYMIPELIITTVVVVILSVSGSIDRIKKITER